MSKRVYVNISDFKTLKEHFNFLKERKYISLGAGGVVLNFKTKSPILLSRFSEMISWTDRKMHQ